MRKRTRRAVWIDLIEDGGASFADTSTALLSELERDIDRGGLEALNEHLRLCGNIPERFKHDSTEEKQYSKYTDALLCLAFRNLGLKSHVLTERANAADVEAFSEDYSFVADAKAFRLSRTAKNQKDFKVQQMDTWKYGKPFAVVVCPIYQMPAKRSAIYQQAITREVLLLSYSHLVSLLRVHQESNGQLGSQILQELFECIPTLHPTPDANNYWSEVNRII